MQPMACTGDAGQPRAGKLCHDQRAVFGQDIGAFCAGQKKCRAIKGAGRPRPADDFWHLTVQHRQVQPPPRRVCPQVQRLQKKRAQDGVGNGFGQSLVGIGPVGKTGQVKPGHGGDILALVMAVGHRGNIGHHQFAQKRALRQRQNHSGFATHRMAQNIGNTAVRHDHLCQIGGHFGVALGRFARTIAMVAHINGDDGPRVGQTPRYHAPVATRAKQPVRNQQGRLVKRPCGRKQREIQHGGSLSHLVRSGQRCCQTRRAKDKVRASDDGGMMSAVTIQQMAERITALMEQRLRIKGKDLHEKLRKGGRVLPRRVRAAAEQLADAAERSQNPKLLLQIDEAQVTTAYDVCSKHLSKIDAGYRRTSSVLRQASSMVISLIAVALIVAGVLYWRGYL